ncbi:unnamed protein product [Calicophoron daubneyi]|uniref:Protein Lines N-terminal domain-containing protein n=1 Tax=Calicophoron daubneyi TaxID=300641 RepID=A0AAV2TP56_CALDB
MQGRELAEFIPNTDWLFARFVSSIGFAPYLLVDWLVSPETSCLTYLVHYLRRFRSREDKRHFSATSGDEPSESHSETCAVDKHGVPSFPQFDQSEWPTEPIRSMLIQVSRCLSTLEANRNIAFSPLPLIRSINYVVSILPSRSVPIGHGVKR